MSLMIIITCSVFLIFFFFSQWNMLYYPIRELCHLVVFICTIAIPFEMVIGLYIGIKYWREKKAFHFVNTVLHGLSVLLTCFCVIFYVYQMNSVVSEGQVKDFQLYSYENKCYVVLDNVYIPISAEQYETINPNKWYHFVYSYNRLRPNTYTMITFEADDLQ